MGEDLPPELESAIDSAVALALAEDIGSGDVTSELTIESRASGRGQLLCKEDGVLAGMEVARRAFAAAARSLAISAIEISGALEDGQRVARGDRGVP